MNETCLLCKDKKVYHIESHLTPAVITENTFGKRGKELIYSIDPKSKKIDRFFGRQHPQKQIIEIKNAPNSKKAIFCKKCEDDLGKYEKAVQDIFKSLLKKIDRGLIWNKTKFQIKYVNIDLDPNILTIFFLSIVWRQCLQQTLHGNINPLNTKVFKELQLLVLENISIPIKDIIKKRIIESLNIYIFTSYQTRKLSTFVGPHAVDSNPLVFFIGPIMLLYKIDNNISLEFESKTLINQNLIDDELSINKSRLGVLSQKPWKNIHKKLAESLAEQFLYSYDKA
jgi:hypothetical protein